MDEFEIRRFDEGEEPKMIARQDQTRAEAIECLRKAEAFIVTTVVRRDDGSMDVGNYTSVSAILPEIFSLMLQSTAEAVAASWFLNSGTDPLSFIMLVTAFTESARVTLRETIAELEGGEG